MEKIRDTDGESLAQFVDDPKFDGIIRTMDDIADGGLGDTTAGRKLILGHFLLRKEFRQPHTDGLIQLQWDHHSFICIFRLLYGRR